ncbi:hypothetical protein BGZ63DRAFT_356070 [Mariannaea sp. PMI_226]|nr:hypothetical protein BGZ63DRAFT_356070 [Mariannaea sp. PMI_226]
MPCCIAIIRFLQCGHKNLFKIGCTKGCENLCEVSRQRTLLVTEYLWMCEDCNLRIWGEEDDTRADAWEVRADGIRSDFSHSHRTDLLNGLVDNLHARERLEDKRVEATRLLRLEETQWVAEWTFEYAMMIFDVLYKQVYDPQRARERIRQLLTLRLWDLIVVRDSLRDGKELLRHQSKRSGFIISG